MIPYLKPDLPDWEAVRPELEEVYRSGKFHPGKYVERFEAALCAKLGCAHAVMVSTASDGLALLLALRAHDIQLRASVVGPDFTFRATPQAAHWAGLTYLPCDANDTGNMSVEHLRLLLSRRRPLAILGIHVFGLPCDELAMRRVCSETGTDAPIYYDAAHALGSKFDDGSYVGCCANADAECFSLNITKAVPSCGEGGVITTNDLKLAERLRAARWHGDVPGSLDWKLPGMNAKPTEWQAVVAYHALQRMDDRVSRRVLAAQRYDLLLSSGPTQPFHPVRRHGLDCYKDYAVLAPSADDSARICTALSAAGIQFKRYFLPVSAMAMMQRRDDELSSWRRSRDLYSRIICLPMGSDITAEEQAEVVNAMRRA